MTEIGHMEKEAEYLGFCEELKKLIEATGEPLEGNCMYRHLTFEPWDCLLNKRINYQTVAKQASSVCEIGFNAGHSILAMILVNPGAEYVLFDLGDHKYAAACFEYLQSRFPETRLEMTWGDSRTTLSDYRNEHPLKRFDVLHIDGSHKSDVYKRDWENALHMVSKDGILIFDDTDNVKISAFIDGEIKAGNVHEADGFLRTSGYEHRILIKN